jgi:hypothetical protein
LSFTISKAATTISLSSTTSGNILIVTAKVGASLPVNAISPTGLVAFTNTTTGKVLGTVVPYGPCTGATSLCVTYAINVDSTQLAFGSSSIVAEFNGDTSFLDSGVSAPLTFTCDTRCYNVNGYTLGLPFYQSTPPDFMVAAGGTLTDPVSLEPGGGFTGAVNLTCSVKGKNAADQNIPTCSFNSAQVNITDPNVAVDTVLTLKTTAPRTTAAVPARHARRLTPIDGLALAALLLCGLPIRRIRRYLPMLVVLLLVGGFSACGGGGGGAGGGGGGTTIPGTTADIYAITFRAADVATGTVTAQNSFNMTVQ